jgi:hypothetical protein
MCNERLATSRALLRYNISGDKQHSAVMDGLHPMYVALHGSIEAGQEHRQEVADLLDQSYKDVLDAVSRTVFFSYSSNF